MTEKNGTPPRLDILEALGKHLLSGKLNHEKFYMGFLSDNRTVPNEKFGDAISELPFLFPEEFEFRGYYQSRNVLWKSLMVSERTANYIFGFTEGNDPKMKFQNLGDILCNTSHYPTEFGQLPKSKEVGKQILDFVKRYKRTYPNKSTPKV